MSSRAKQKGKPKDPLRVARGKLGKALRKFEAQRAICAMLITDLKQERIAIINLSADLDRSRQKVINAEAYTRIAKSAQAIATLEMHAWKRGAEAAEAENVRLRIEAAGEYGLVPSGLLSIEHYQIS